MCSLYYHLLHKATLLLKNIVETELIFFSSPDVETVEFVIPFQQISCIILENIFNDNTKQKPNAHLLVQQNQHKMDYFVGRQHGIFSSLVSL